MKIVKPYIKQLTLHFPQDDLLKWLESLARTCYKSHDKITKESAFQFIQKIVELGHETVFEHITATAIIVGDRGMSHELVRHRLASYLQESTRYCNYSKDKFGREIKVVEQPGIEKDNSNLPSRSIWENAMEYAEKAYFELLDCGIPPQIARSVLPIGLKTEIVVTANLREWKHIFALRCSQKAHPIIRGLMTDLLKKFHKQIPYYYNELACQYLSCKSDNDCQCKD